MARIRPTLALRNDRAGRNKRKSPAAAPRSKTSFWSGVDWGKMRLLGVSFLFAGFWLLLWARAYQVQVIRGPRYAEEARRAHLATEMATGRRGALFDRNGNVLAQSVESRSVALRPGLVTDQAAVVKLLSSALEIPAAKANSFFSTKRSFVWAARKISPRAAESIQQAALPGVYLLREYERVYPFKHLAGQLVGFVDVDDNGIEGLEKALNETLSGQKKRKVLQRDATGRRFYSDSEGHYEDLTGDDVTLTVDTQVQYFAESALFEGVETFGARWAGCMVVDVPSGDILAWAEYPFFNPNKPSASTPFERRNKTAMDALEQGSTIKPFLMAAALQEGVITPESEYNCEKGRWRLRNVVIRDTSVHGVLPAKDILKVSSNIGVAKIGMELGVQKYHDYLMRLGFGDRTGLPLAGENRGIVHPVRQWSEVDLASASFGQSFSATIVQMAQAYLCLANDGVKKNLRLVVSGEKQDAEERIFSPEVMRDVRDMLRSAVEDSGGTGQRARIAGLVVGGKTGTAQKASGDAYGAGRVASFVGMLPVGNPRYLVVVMLDEPVKNQYGGVVAAPIFKNVALRTMAYHGLLPEKTSAQFTQELEGSAAAKNEELAIPAVEQPRTRLVNIAENAAKAQLTPAVVGMSAREAVETFARHGVVPVLKGEGNVVVRQQPEPGMPFLRPNLEKPDDDTCTLWLGERS